jgi:hypothetical protein
VKAAAIATLVLGGCSWVYNAQYDDRAGELEKARTVFVPGANQPQFLTATDHKVYWVDSPEPARVPVMHSFDTATARQVDYGFQITSSNLASDYRMTDTLVVHCPGGTTTAFDANSPNAMIDMNSMGGSSCQAAGSDVYFIIGETITKWTPGTGNTMPTVVVDFSNIGGGNLSIGGFGVVGKTLVALVGTAFYTIDLTTNMRTYLMNPDASLSGTIVFDDRGVLYGTSGSALTNNTTYSAYADKSSFLLEHAIDDGGYDLNFQHNDIHQLGDNNEYAMAKHYVIYRAKKGIFAYGFDSKKVIDVLFDRDAADGFGSKPLYRNPTITADGIVFVQDLSDTGPTTDHPIYRVDLTSRLP